MKKIINALIVLFVMLIAGCSSGGSSGSSSGGNETPISIGTLPNGSAVYISQNDLPVSNGTPAQASIYLEGGSANESYNITFATNQQLATRLKTSESYGINITTSPTPCVIGTVGSGAPSQCQVTVASSATTYPGTYLITPSATPISGGTATTLSRLTILVSGSIKPSTKAITSFSLNGTAGVINGQNIAVTMPHGTNVTALIATYITTGQSVKVGNVTQQNGVTPNNFSSPVVYTVTAEDGSIQNYTVTVTVAANTAKAITAYSLNGTAGVITGQYIAVTMPYGTNVTSLVATYITTGQSVKVGNVTQQNGVTPNNFTSPVVYTVTAEDGSAQNYTVTVSVAANTAKAITAFSLNGTDGVISGQSISVNMPYGTDVTALIATFTTSGQSVKVSSTAQTSGVTPNNFSSSVVYTVTAEDGSTQNYTVTVTVAPNSAKAITAFSLNGTDGVISGQSISVNMPYGTDVTALIATFTTSGQSVKVGSTAQTSGVTPNNISSPVVYTVIAEDGSTQNYTVTVTVAQNSAKEITAFSLDGTDGDIDQVNKTIAVVMPFGTDVTALIATFTTSGQSVKVSSTAQTNGVTPNNFSSPVVYTVTAEDGSTQNYTVTVTVAQNSAKEITAFSLDGTDGDIDQVNKTIAVVMPFGTDITTLIATFTTNGQSVKVGSTTQTSGMTPNDFTNPVVYTVTAEDGSTRNYTVTVTVAKEWGPVGSAGFSVGQASYQSLALAPDGTPYVAYQDTGDGGKSIVMKFNGTSWESVGSAASSASATYQSLAIAADGTPYIAYKDGAVGAAANKATVMKFNGTNWESVGSAGFSAGSVAYLSLSIAPSGTANAGKPYVAYQDVANSQKTTVMMFNGASWESVGSSGFSTTQANFQSLAIYSDGTPYVAYQDGSTSTGKTTVMKFNGTSWVVVGSAEFSAGKATYQSLKITTDGIPYVAYIDGTDFVNKTTVMKFNGTSWLTVGNAKFTPPSTNYTSLAIASGGIPYVAQMVSGKATIMMFNGNSWVDVGNPEFSASPSQNPSLAINNTTGNLYVAYRDAGNGYKTTVMGY